MKKRLKKILAVALLFTLIFTFTIKPKQSEAVVAEFTIAGLVASGMALPAALIAIAGAAAIGGLIGTNMDGIRKFGDDLWADMTASGSNPAGLVDETNKTVTMSPELVNSAARVADTSTTIQQVIADNFFAIATPVKPTNSWQTSVVDIQSFTIGAAEKVVFWTFTGANVSMESNYIKLRKADGSLFQISASYSDGHYSRYETGTNLYGATITGVSAFLMSPDSGYYANTNSSIVYKGKSYTNANTLPVTNVSTPSITTEADNVYQRQLYANSLLSQNQVLQLDENMDYANSTLEDVLSAQEGTYDETKTQTGILNNMWNIIKGIPASIAAAGVAASTAINANMDQLWEDAGAIWTGMSDSLINIQTDVNAKIGAMQTAMSGGIDNIRTDMGTLMGNLSAGIDSFAASAAANWASWGQLTLDGIDAGIGAITSGLSTAWTNTTTAIDTAATATTTAINTGIGTITDGLTTITDWITGFPAMFFSWFVPPDFSFLGPLITQATNDLEDKVGSLPSLEDITSAITIQEKSIYEIEISLMGKNYKIVPLALKPTIDGARPFLTAAVNLTSITFLIHRNKRELFK